MDDIKYLGVQGLEELIVLAQNGLAKKADTLQFDVMPDPIKYIGKVVQYIGVSDVSFTRSHFYYSNGIKWTEENISGEHTTQIEMVTALPSWTNADPQILYILKDTTDKKMGLYVKNPSVVDSWFTVESSGSFTVVAALPQWGDADSNTIYLKADGNILTGYIKKTGTIDAWYTLGGTGSETIVDSALSATSTNPVQNKVIYAAIQDVLAQVSSVYHYKGSCLAADLPKTDNKVGDTWNLEDASSYGPSGTNVAWDGTKWDALGGDITHFVRNPAWKQAILLSVEALTGGYKAPADGMIVGILYTHGNTSTGVSVTVNGVEVARNKAKDSDHILNVQCPVGKGDIITISDEESQINSAIRFVPFEDRAVSDVEVVTPEDSAVSDVEVVTPELIRNLHDPDWSQAVSITATQLAGGYTVPKRGIIVGSIIPNTYSVTGSPIIKINGIIVSYARGSSNEISHGSVQCPVCANDRASLEGISAGSCDAHISFVPYKAQ